MPREGGASSNHEQCKEFGPQRLLDHPPARVTAHDMTATVLKLIARRLIVAVPILLIVSALLFCILRLLPVDPAAMSLPPNATIAEIEDKRREMGLDKPLPQQYLIWLAGALHGDFGRSIALRRV